MDGKLSREELGEKLARLSRQANAILEPSSGEYPNFCVRGLFSLTHHWVNDCKRRMRQRVR